MSASRGWKYGQTVTVISDRLATLLGQEVVERASGSASSSGDRLKVCQPWAARATRAGRHRTRHRCGWAAGDWMGLGNIWHGIERIELALERRGLVSPQRAEYLEVLVGPPAPLGPGHVDRPELLLQPAHADPEVDPTVGQPVQRGHLLGRVDGVALGEQHHGRAQPDGGGVGGQERQGVERLEQAGPGRCGDLAVLGVGVGGGVLLEQDDVLAHPEAPEAPLLGLRPMKASSSGVEIGEAVGTQSSTRCMDDRSPRNDAVRAGRYPCRSMPWSA